jgi:methyltransferase (TIGR00027 family)
MKIDLGGETNRGAAFLRLIHQFRDKPAVRDESLQWFFDGKTITQAREMVPILDATHSGGEDRFLQIAYWWVILRDRFVDDVVKLAVDGGCEHVLNLGSGYDTRFFRIRRSNGEPVETFEVDLEDTITHKRHCIERAVGTVPPELHLIPLDLRRESLERLVDSGYAIDRSTTCVWQGVSYYLPQESVQETLGFVRHRTGPGTVFVFDACTPLMITANDEIPGIRSQIEKLREIGEPYVFGCEPDSMSQMLADLGFVDIEIASLSEMEHRYLGQRTLPDNMWYMVRAKTPTP